MTGLAVHKSFEDRRSFFYVDWEDKSNIVALAFAVLLFLFGFYYIFKALGFHF
ncbi:MAG: hypothetical protein WC755_05330 [Candidatus Woesearchaeota archaeon]|jgi:hypothetical protein